MSLYGDYDAENVFAKILRGDAPCHYVYEDEDILAFLDGFPQSLGHTLIIPRHQRARNLIELDDVAIAPLFTCAKRLMQILIDELQPDGVQLMQFNGGQGGQSVFHVHVHLIPRWPGQPLGVHSQTAGNPEELAALAARLRARAIPKERRIR
ncbi:histidine triad (HIT) family protein [Sphingobium xenophagum]|uniref:Histidine triad (HIT) family protein n=1 Tax=Sphingobium xenophagum TaxID=121428 RepID=A0ABU1X4S7_SPHXE|nr:HIT domain-containing protein [Sphingobium xenophagum]MDR7156479.1 histidine triad (HIT) family protein [Sphingobium xenophagum]